MSTVLYVAYAIYAPGSRLKKYAVPSLLKVAKALLQHDKHFLLLFSISPGFVPCAKSSLNGQLAEHVLVS